MGDFVDHATKDLLIKAMELSNGKAIPPLDRAATAATAAATRQFDNAILEEVKNKARTTTYNKRNLFNEGLYKEVRLSHSLGHYPVPVDKSAKQCAFCHDSKRKTECSICGVVLCCTNNSNGSTCFKDWHEQAELPS
jgi:hypothetical protein